MTDRGRPEPFDRWEVRLGLSLLGLAMAAARRAQQDPPVAPADAPAAAQRWAARRRAAARRHPWRRQVQAEQAALQAAVGLWVAWRSYQLERAARQAG